MKPKPKSGNFHVHDLRWIVEDVNGWCFVHFIVGIISSFIISVYVRFEMEKMSCKRVQVQVLRLEMIKPRRRKNECPNKKKLATRMERKEPRIVISFFWIHILLNSTLFFWLFALRSIVMIKVYVLHCHKNPLKYVWETWKGENVKICHPHTYYIYEMCTRQWMDIGHGSTGIYTS